MEDFNEVVKPSTSGKGRKKLQQPQKRKRFLLKAARHKPQQLPVYPTCNHLNAPGKPYNCATLTMKQIKDFHSKFYAKPDKIYQDTLVVKCCTAMVPKKVKNKKNPTHKVSIKYYIPIQSGNLVRVCKKAFMEVLHISRDRIERVMKNFLIQNELPIERRGGDRVLNKNKEKLNSIGLFIEKLNCAEAHYCRSKSSERKYLPCDLNFKKLWIMYQSSVPDNLQVKLSYFKYHVKRKYNLAFGTPQTDLCSYCLRCKEIITKGNLTDKEKVKMITEHRVHKLKAKAFFRLLQSNHEDIEIFSFDCQKNLCLPKLPDQASYFSQQFNYYNFTVVNGPSKGMLNKSTVLAYMWNELDAPKNSNAISSAVYDTLNNFNFMPTTTTVRLFADGCGGQNKNVTVMCMIAVWLRNYAPAHIQTVEIIFPIVGHSFLPPDRIFGFIEKEVKKTPIIVEPRQYDDIIKKHATLRKIGSQWNIFDFKAEAKAHLKLPGSWHFQFNKSKRFIFKKSGKAGVTVRGEPHYVNDIGVAKGILKQGHKLKDITPQTLPIGRKIKGDKRSIARLLNTHYGKDWEGIPELDYYKRALSQITTHLDLQSEENDERCEVIEDINVAV